ncbi:hypothetical protein ABT147_34275 [Streptomyces sp. NPDC001868]|uniref:hypothetical protein n=1 Tax=Streptomyces sp. NPDC001868 TaxID=3154401 RepID=UPI003323E377
MRRITIDVEATTSAGETTVRKNAGTLRYRKQPVFQTFAVTPTAPTIDDRTVTVSGDMVVRDPSTRANEPLSDASVDLKIGQRIETTATTDQNGHFSVSRELAEGGWAWATYQGDLGYVSTSWVDIAPKAAPTRLVLDKASFHPTARDRITVSGTLRYQSGSEWKPLSGIPLEMDHNERVSVAVQYSPDGKSGWTTEKTVKTGFDEQFRVRVPGHTDGYGGCGTPVPRRTTSRAPPAARHASTGPSPGSKSYGSSSKGFKAQQDGTWMPVHLKPDSKHFVGSGEEDYVDVR